MTDIYAMRRANGDWFAIDDHGRIRVPLFHTAHDAKMARLRNFGMLLFEPVALNARWLSEIAPAGGGSEVDFCLVNDPFAGLDRGRPLGPDQLASLISERDQGKPALQNQNLLSTSRTEPKQLRAS